MKFRLSEEKKQGKKNIIGKLVSDRVIGKEVICSMMGKIWKMGKTFSFHILSPNLFLVSFESQADWKKKKILKGRPWLFDNYLFLLKPYERLIPSNKIEFEKESF